MRNDVLVAARKFFDYRASFIGRKPPTLDQLCYVSGRHAGIWCDSKVYSGMVDNILSNLDASINAELLEVGCAAGFIALGLAPRVRKYVGIDLASKPLQIACNLGLVNAEFYQDDGMCLSFSDNKFDAVFTYHTLINIPSFAMISTMIKEMLRVTKPGGKVLLGAIPDIEMEQACILAAPAIEAELLEKYGAREKKNQKRLWAWLKNKFNQIFKLEGSVAYFSFKKQDFIKLGEELNIPVKISAVHSENPYAIYKFDVIYTKPQT